MHFPYGISDFAKIIRSGQFYQDRTDRIPLLEASGDQLVFIRPRRFGKSLLLSMLEHYYDINRADQFEALFGGLAIGQNPIVLGDIIRRENVAESIDLYPEFNDLCGFTEAEIRAVLAQLAAEGVSWSTTEALRANCSTRLSAKSAPEHSN